MIVETHNHVLVDGDYYPECGCSGHDFINATEAITYALQRVDELRSNGYTEVLPMGYLEWQCTTDNGSITTVGVVEKDKTLTDIQRDRILAYIKANPVEYPTFPIYKRSSVYV